MGVVGKDAVKGSGPKGRSTRSGGRTREPPGFGSPARRHAAALLPAGHEGGVSSRHEDSLRRRIALACLSLLAVSSVSCEWDDTAAFPRIGSGRRADVFPGEEWTAVSVSEAGMLETKLVEARDFALRGGGSGLVTRGGRRVFSWGDIHRRFDLKSTTKSFGAGALALAVADGKLELDDIARDHHPMLGVPPGTNAATGWLARITVCHLASQTAGFDKSGGYTELLFEPGTKWAYSDGGPNWLAESITLLYRRDLHELMHERVFAPLGIDERDLTWRSNRYRPTQIGGIARREFGAGIHASVDAMARYGLLWLRGGRWNGRQLLPASFVGRAVRTDDAVRRVPVVDRGHYHDASRHYALLWWNNQDGKLSRVPRDAYWSWGLHESLIVVIPSLDLVVARAGKQGWQSGWGADYETVRPFLEALVDSVVERPRWAGGGPPYPPSRIVRSLEWAAPSSVVREARGSDNWPTTWGDDDCLYTAYGDGRGFEPRVPQKLSLGLARVCGTPLAPGGENLRSAGIEARGDGARGRKASGILMVDGVLHVLVRNAGNSTISISSDRGETWRDVAWSFDTSFGYPTFLNFGKNYDGARDDFVYVFSHDNASAYEAADRMVLARVPRARIGLKDAYEFFAGMPVGGEPRWSRDVAERAAVFENAGGCYRSGISYNRGLRRYIWCQILPPRGRGPRFEGGFGIYDAAEPWGPWTTLFFTESWDMGPGETSHFPTKWMSADGLEMHLVFSGNDCFSVRKVNVEPAASR